MSTIKYNDFTQWVHFVNDCIQSTRPTKNDASNYGKHHQHLIIRLKKTERRNQQIN